MDTSVFMENYMSNEKKPVYTLCPRCELNYIKSTEELCDVCKVEMGLLEKSFLIQEDELEAESGKLCPVCHANYIGEDEEICFVCRKEKEAKEHAEEPEEEDDWTYVEEEEELPPEEMMISLELTAEEENEEEEDDTFDENAYKEADDFNYDVDPSDFEDYDEEEEDEDDDEDDDL